MWSLSSKNQTVKYLLCVIHVFNKYALVKPLKNKKGKRVLNTFIGIVYKSNCKPNKRWFDQGRTFYNKQIQEWLDNNDVFNFLIHNKENSVIAERFKKTLKSWH